MGGGSAVWWGGVLKWGGGSTRVLCEEFFNFLEGEKTIADVV